MVNDPAEPVPLSTGALSAVLREGALHDIRLGGITVLDGVYLAVRDRDWGTVPGDLHDHDVRADEDGFLVTYTAVHRSAGVAFRYEARIEGRDGRITFAMDGAAEREFPGNRVGFCLLHPQDLAGREVTVTTPDGVVPGVFPCRISPHQPFPEMSGMAYRSQAGPSGGDFDFRIDFHGELFETEDQRNWTDASYKTYCTPLRLPYPRTFTPADPVRQAVVLTGGGDGAAAGRRTPPRSSRPAGPWSAGSSGTADLTVLGPGAGRLPELGFGLPSQGGPLDEDEAALIRALRPGHLRIELHAERSWRSVLKHAVHDSARVGAPLDVELICRDEAGLADLVAALTGDADVRRVHAYDADTHTTPPRLARRLRELTAEYGLRAPSGGGSRANFAELNRAAPLRDLDFITFAISPQVHAFDNASVMGTLRAQSLTVVQAAEIGGGRPVVVGPVTLLPRFNPVATGMAGDPAPGADTSEPAGPAPGVLPPEVDVRQAGAFTAAWTVGSLAALRGAQALTYYEAVGWRGLAARRDPDLADPRFPGRPGEVFPVYQVFRELADVAGGPLYEIAAAPGLAGLAVGGHAGVRLVVANLSERPRRIRINGLGEPIARAPGGDMQQDLKGHTLPGHGLAVVDGQPETEH